jgi:hypothetical protein
MKTEIHNLFPDLNEDTKVCGICQQALPLTMFGTDGGAKYLRYECKPCAKKQSKIVAELKKKNPPPPVNHTCPICERTEAEIKAKNPDKKGIWCADHNHDTNTFRGWICHKCNLGLGNFNDIIKSLENAVRYLKNEIH